MRMAAAYSESMKGVASSANFAWSAIVDNLPPGCDNPEGGYVGAVAEFLTDIKTLRERARQKIEEGPITQAYGADRERVIEVLNEALATELVCVLRYKRHYFTASGIHSQAAANEFLQHATEEQGHADQLALRITQLQGSPNFDPDGLTSRSHTQYDASEKLTDRKSVV